MALPEGVERPCEACGMKIKGIMGPKGKVIPAQRVRTVYHRRGGEPLSKVIFSEGKEIYVSHFETCPSPERFSRRS